ncbi:MAG: ABC transporter permease [Alphaproteobacteria bacterium]|nr:ABC transporter permease [Alphaproteobacteria bacterium]
MSTLSQRRWLKFKQNKRAYLSMWLLLVVVIISMVAPFIANSKPLILMYKHNLYFPFVQFIKDDMLGGNLPTEAVYSDSYTRTQINSNGWAVYPLVPYKYDTVDYFSTEPFPAPPSKQHLLGTDDQGRDVLARLLYALRLSLIFTIILTFFSAIIGISIGAIQGYLGGKTDLFIGRFLEIWGSLPQLFILIILSSLIEPGFISLLLILLLFGWTSLTGVVRAEFLKTRGLDYVKSAKALGVSDFRIMVRHILPNALVTTITYIPFMLAGGIVALSALDFLGLGLPVGTPSLGELIRQGKENLAAPWLGLTAFCVMTVLLSLLLFIGEGIRDAFDPHQEKNE